MKPPSRPCARWALLYAGLAAACVVPPVAHGGNVMLLIGNSNNTQTTGGFSTGDRFLRDRLRDALKHAVSVVPDSVSKDSILRSAARADLVVVLESTTSVKLVDKLKTTPTPILNFEAFIQDEMGLTAAGPPGDPGAPDQFAFGVLDKSDAIAIRDPAHPLAAGFSGRIQVYSQPKSVTWGKVAPAAHVVATLASDTAGAAIYVYAAGARLFDGTQAAGMRIGFFLEDDNVTGTPNLMTPAGLALFDQAVAYGIAKGTTTGLRTPFPGKSRPQPSRRGMEPGVDPLGRVRMPSESPLESPSESSSESFRPWFRIPEIPESRTFSK